MKEKKLKLFIIIILIITIIMGIINLSLLIKLKNDIEYLYEDNECLRDEYIALWTTINNMEGNKNNEE